MIDNVIPASMTSNWMRSFVGALNAVDTRTFSVQAATSGLQLLITQLKVSIRETAGAGGVAIVNVDLSDLAGNLYFRDWLPGQSQTSGIVSLERHWNDPPKIMPVGVGLQVTIATTGNVSLLWALELAGYQTASIVLPAQASVTTIP